MWQFSGALRPPSPLGSMLDLVLMVEFLRLTALKFSTLTRGEGVCDHFFTFMWSDPSMMPSFFVAFLSVKTIKKIFWYDELFSPKSHTLAGSVSELSHTGEIFWPPNGAIRWMQQYACIRLNTFAALKFSTLTRGGGGWRPFLHLHVKWCFDDVLIFRCVPLSKNDQIVFEILNYFPQKRTLWRGQSLSSPILLRRRFSDPPNAANRWMQQCVCIRLNASA